MTEAGAACEEGALLPGEKRNRVRSPGGGNPRESQSGSMPNAESKTGLDFMTSLKSRDTKGAWVA